MPKDKRPEEYGVDEYIPDGILNQLYHPLKGIDNPFRVVLHPIQSFAKLFSFIRKLLRGVWKSTFRKRGHRPTSDGWP